MSDVSTANGTYSDCGVGSPPSVIVTCGGPSCSALHTQNLLTCTSMDDTSTVHCNNSVTCPGPVNFVSNFTFVQMELLVSIMQNITVDGYKYSIDDPGDGQPVSTTSIGTVPGTSPTSGACPTVSTTSAAAVSTASVKSAANRNSFGHRRSYPSLMLVLVMIMSLFITHIQAQSPSADLNEINGLFPAGHQTLLQQVEQSYCQGSVF